MSWSLSENVVSAFMLGIQQKLMIRHMYVRAPERSPHPASADQREAAKVLRHRRKPTDGTPAHAAVVRAVYAALVRGPHLTSADAGNQQRRDRARRIRPPVANPLPRVVPGAVVHAP